ncbi:hypothetical protein VTO73DRAFT_11667 [Trametes versicolor]
MVVTAGFLLYAEADAMSGTASDDGMPKLVAPPSQVPPARRRAPRISAQKLSATGETRVSISHSVHISSTTTLV